MFTPDGCGLGAWVAVGGGGRAFDAKPATQYQYPVVRPLQLSCNAGFHSCRRDSDTYPNSSRIVRHVSSFILRYHQFESQLWRIPTDLLRLIKPFAPGEYASLRWCSYEGEVDCRKHLWFVWCIRQQRCRTWLHKISHCQRLLPTSTNADEPLIKQASAIFSERSIPLVPYPCQ